MDHVSLTCKNHPDLRWSCKEIAWSEGYGYNGSRHIFFFGMVNTRPDRGRYDDHTEIRYQDGFPWQPSDEDNKAAMIAEHGKLELVKECSCPASDLVRVVETETGKSKSK